MIDFNSLLPCCLIWRYRTWSTLLQVLACCMKSPSRYLNKCWLINSYVMWQLPKGNFTWNAKDIYSWYEWDRWIPRRNGQLRGKCFHLMTSSWWGIKPFHLISTQIYCRFAILYILMILGCLGLSSFFCFIVICAFEVINVRLFICLNLCQ